MRSIRVLPWCLVLLSLLLVSSGVPSFAGEEKDEEKNFVQKVLNWVEVADPIVTDKIVLFPLVVPRPFGDVGVDALEAGKDVSFKEPDFPRHRYDVLVRNEGDRPVVIIGGTVLEGGKRDRMVRRTAIVGPKGETEIRALPAATTSDIRKEPVPFRVADSLAPIYLRRKAEYGGSANTVMTFIVRWLGFRNPGDERESLVAIASADRLESFCVPCQQAAARFPQVEEGGPRVVGGVGVIRGRIQGMFVYGNNKLVHANFPMMLKGATYTAAAIELTAAKAGVPLPGTEDPEATLEIVTAEVKDLVDKVRKARFRKDDVGKGELGEALLLRTSDGTRGRAVGYDGRLVQLFVYPHDPFQNVLYGSAVNLPEEGVESDPDRPGVADLERRARQRGQRLTAAERRLLGRLRGRGGAGGRR